MAFQNHTDVFFQPMLYFIGHMSKFAKTGARRLKSHVTGLYREGGLTYSGAVPGEVPVGILSCTNITSSSSVVEPLSLLLATHSVHIVIYKIHDHVT